MHEGCLDATVVHRQRTGRRSLTPCLAHSTPQHLGWSANWRARLLDDATRPRNPRWATFGAVYRHHDAVAPDGASHMA